MAERSLKHSIARWISIAGHPFVLLPLAVGYVSWKRLSFEEGLTTMAMLLGWFLLFGVYVGIQVRRGVWSDVDVSAREQRPHMFLLAVPLAVATSLILWWRGQSMSVVMGTASAAAMLAVASIINRWIKVSLHSAFAVYAVAIPLPVLGLPGLALFAIPAAVAWGRVAMGRHTTPEVLLGLALGAMASIPIVAQ
jgi:hypothetical protein